MYRVLKQARRTLLRVEALEPRRMLSGMVNVAFNPVTGLLRFDGDVDPNSVLVTPGDNPGEYRIAGEDGTSINGPALIEDPVTRIEVDLAGGSDTFRIEGTDASQLNVTAEVVIANQDGWNRNEFVNVFLSQYLTVTKTAGTSESYLDIMDSTVVGPVTVNNFNGGVGAGHSKTTISGSHLQDDLIIDNGAGKDILVVYDSTIDGNVVVNNRDGDTRTVFGQEEDPIVWGNLTLVNGAGNDTVIIHDTAVWGNVTLNLGDGHTDVTVEDSNIGLGAPVGPGDSLDIDAGAGFDTFLMRNSSVRDDLDIVTGAVIAHPFATQTFGSSITIDGNSTIGNDLDFYGDNGREIIALTNSQIFDDIALTLYNGSSDVTFSGAHISERLDLTSGAGADRIEITEETVIQGDVVVNLGDGVDWLGVLAGSELLGSTSLTGGADLDTFVRQILPEAEAVDIAFLAWEDFEIDDFVTE